MKRFNTDLAAVQSFLQTVLDSSVEMVAAFDTGLNYTFVNRKVEEFTGKTMKEVIGKHITTVHPALSILVRIKKRKPFKVCAL